MERVKVKTVSSQKTPSIDHKKSAGLRHAILGETLLVKSLLEQLLSRESAQLYDLNDLQLIDSSFLPEDFSSNLSNRLWKTKYKDDGSEAYIGLLYDLDQLLWEFADMYNFGCAVYCCDQFGNPSDDQEQYNVNSSGKQLILPVMLHNRPYRQVFESLDRPERHKLSFRCEHINLNDGRVRFKLGLSLASFYIKAEQTPDIKAAIKLINEMNLKREIFADNFSLKQKIALRSIESAVMRCRFSYEDYQEAVKIASAPWIENNLHSEKAG